MRYLQQKLYRISTASFVPIKNWPESVMGFKLVVYEPGLFCLGRFHMNPLINLMWYIITRGRFRILLLFDKEIIVHSYYITSKTFRFGYMNKNDINLGQTFTIPEYRGRGIHTSMEKVIISYYSNEPRFLWGYVDVRNKASQRVLDKVGFEFVAYARMSMLTGIVRILENQKND